ncbi:MAG: YkgJ family cysteine cluster protein [Maricaulis sp.]|nr:YkgJ family cysteine cluster protein [Maricaulis sp.]MDG2043748.1 YkgJ family cysteine cluster protein [Maricaulis sp.]
MSSENPCLKCTLELSCCASLSGLRVNQTEFDRCFADVADQFDVERDGPFYRLSVKNGGACPHLETQCTIYEDRPMECALFPHTIGAVFDNDTLLMTVHKRTDCPQKADLAMDDAEAVNRVEQFARETVGADAKIRVILDEGPARMEVLARRVLRKLKPN